MYLLATPQTTCYRQKTPDSLREIQGFCQVFCLGFCQSFCRVFCRGFCQGFC